MPSVCALRRICLPLQGRLYGQLPHGKAPLQGELAAKPTEGCIAGSRRGYPVKFGSTLPCIRRGRCWHRPANPAMPQCPRRRAKSPALHCGRDRAATDERPLSVKHAGGPMRSSAPAQRRAAACHPRRCCMPALHCRAGVHARRKGLRRPGRILAGQGAAPLRRLRRHLPLQGRLYGQLPHGKAPLQGELAAKPPEGCIAGSRRGYPVKFGSTLPCIRRGRCLHRPGNLPYRKPQAAGEIARPTLWPGPGGDR